jgi:hypothetical protein
MVAGLYLLKYVIAAYALWLNRQRQEVIDYLKEENRLLKEKLSNRKLLFTDAECFVGSIKSECVSRLIFFGGTSLRRALREYITYYQREPNHQGLSNQLITANDAEFEGDAPIAQRSLGSMLTYHHREAA